MTGLHFKKCLTQVFTGSDNVIRCLLVKGFSAFDYLLFATR